VSVAGLLLAAGAGRRFGRPKALVAFEGEPLVARGVRLLRDGGCDPVVVVLGAAAADVRPLLPQDVTSVVAPDWDTGMGASLRAGLAALEPTRASACVVALVDQPRIGAEAVRRLRTARGAAAVATYGGRPRNPVLLAREVWQEVAQLAVRDAGARAWLRSHPERVVGVPCDGTGSPADVDTPADLAQLTQPT
jgi:CTP:molybdopterin cytidylyltransferase MocA